MTIISEDTVRQLHFKQGLSEIHADAKAYITKEAREYIRDKKLKLVFVEEPPKNTEAASFTQNPESASFPQVQAGSCGYVGEDGRCYDEKPEHMTHLYGNVLVPNTHSRILFRGRLDSLEAFIIELQVKAYVRGLSRLTEELGELLAYARQLLACEVTGKPLPAIRLFGLNEGELRKMSHHPREYFGIPHLLPDYRLGELGAGLNSLRTRSREAELAAAAAFWDGENLSRRDILQGMNRLSSAVYIMLLRLVTDYYK